MSEPNFSGVDPFVGVSTEAIVDLLLAGDDELTLEARQQLVDMAEAARRAFPAHWAYRLSEAYKEGLRQRWERQIGSAQ